MEPLQRDLCGVFKNEGGKVFKLYRAFSLLIDPEHVPEDIVELLLSILLQHSPQQTLKLFIVKFLVVVGIIFVEDGLEISIELCNHFFDLLGLASSQGDHLGQLFLHLSFLLFLLLVLDNRILKYPHQKVININIRCKVEPHKSHELIHSDEAICVFIYSLEQFLKLFFRGVQSDIVAILFHHQDEILKRNLEGCSEQVLFALESLQGQLSKLDLDQEPHHFIICHAVSHTLFVPEHVPHRKLNFA